MQFEVQQEYDQFWIGVDWMFDERRNFLVGGLGFGIAALVFSILVCML